MNDIAVRVSIINPNFESAVLQALTEANIECHGRFLAPRDIPHSLRGKTILITANEERQRQDESEPLSGFVAVIPVTESLLPELPMLISDAVPKERVPAREVLSQTSSLVRGVMPRVGARTLNELLERKLGEELFLLRKLNSERSLQILCAEVDDASLVKLFEALDEYDLTSTKVAVVINKLPHSTKGRRKFGAIARELRALSIQPAVPLYFDGEIQINGLPSKQTMSAMKPLFDWIANSK